MVTPFDNRGIGNISVENAQNNKGESNLRDDIVDLNADDTLHNTATEGNFTQTEVGSNDLNICQSPVRERPHGYSTLHQHDNRLEEYSDDGFINPSILYHYHFPPY